jgi:DNA-binding SARP family transcriptional activator
MAQFGFSLFGKSRLHRDGRIVEDLEAGKAQELLFYLLLHRDRPHPREVLGDLLWSDLSTSQSRKYLRQALWKLHSVLDGPGMRQGSSILLVDSAWLGINPAADFTLDVAVFESAFSVVEDVPGEELTNEAACSVQVAVDLYRGDLLEDWYQDWCIYERERLQNLYLILLTKLMIHREARGRYETGILSAIRLLRYDPANERAHRALMRMYYRIGDRTAALRQYRRCVDVLQAELGVEPAESTGALYRAICRDEDAALPDASGRTILHPFGTGPTVSVSRLQANLHDFEVRMERLQRDIQMVERRERR